MTITVNRTAAPLIVLSASTGVTAQTAPAISRNLPTFQDTVQVTATRFGEPVVEVPGSISVVTGEQLRARCRTRRRCRSRRRGRATVIT
jgi:outer membrane receptor protein involved in Fe transport